MLHRAVHSSVVLGVLVWACLIYLDERAASGSYHEEREFPRGAYALVACAFSFKILLASLRWLFLSNHESRGPVLLACIIFIIVCVTYLRLWLRTAFFMPAAGGAFFLPSRWAMDIGCAPAICYILGFYPEDNSSTVYAIWLMSLSSMACCMSTLPFITGYQRRCWLGLALFMSPLLSFQVARTVGHSRLKQSAASMTLVSALCNYAIIGLNIPVVVNALALSGLAPPFVSELLMAAADWWVKSVVVSLAIEVTRYCERERKESLMRVLKSNQSYDTFKQMSVAMHHKKRFLSEMVHELRTPLSAICKLADALMDRELDPMVQTSVSFIQTSGNRLVSLINDLLEASQMQNKLPLLSLGQVNLTEVVDAAVDDVRKIMWQQTNIRMFRVSYLTPTIIADHRRVDQILSCILSNACKFTKRGFFRISTGFDLFSSMVFFAVRDTGCGLVLSDVRKVFRVFSRATRLSASCVPSGTGLGLHFIKMLVAAHRGRIAVRSVLGQGTLFVVYLPLVATAPDGPEAEVRAPEDFDDVIDVANFTDLTEPRGEGQPVQQEFPFGSEEVTNLAAMSQTSDSRQLRLESSASAAPSAQLRPRRPPAWHDGGHVSGRRPTQAPRPARPAVEKDAAGPTEPRKGSKDDGRLALNEHPAPSRRPRATGVDPAAAPAATGLAGAGHSMRSMSGFRRNGRGRSSEASHWNAVVTDKDGSEPAAQAHKVFHQCVHDAPLVLSVDDEFINQVVVQTILQPTGCRVLQAMDGEQALAMLQAEPLLPDVLLLDCMMPGVSGHTLCRCIREKYGFRVPIIMISACIAVNEVVICLSQGAMAYIHKPPPRGVMELWVRLSVGVNHALDCELEARVDANQQRRMRRRERPATQFWSQAAVLAVRIGCGAAVPGQQGGPELAVAGSAACRLLKEVASQFDVRLVTPSLPLALFIQPPAAQGAGGGHLSRLLEVAHALHTRLPQGRLLAVRMAAAVGPCWLAASCQLRRTAVSPPLLGPAATCASMLSQLAPASGIWLALDQPTPWGEQHRGRRADEPPACVSRLFSASSKCVRLGSRFCPIWELVSKRDEAVQPRPKARGHRLAW